MSIDRKDIHPDILKAFETDSAVYKLVREALTRGVTLEVLYMEIAVYTHRELTRLRRVMINMHMHQSGVPQTLIDTTEDVPLNVLSIETRLEMTGSSLALSRMRDPEIPPTEPDALG
jgi:hypothetical protein